MGRIYYMNINEIIGDALRYPLSDWKKILILGFIILVGSIFYLIFHIISNTINNVTILIFLIWFIILFFIFGYQYRIINFTMNGNAELPKFNSWKVMFIEGIKYYIVHLVYLIPALLLLSVYPLYFLALIRDPAPLTFIPYLEDFIRIIISGTNFASYFWLWVSILIMSLYLFIITPILYMGLANMIKNNGKLRNALSFRLIFNKITKNGLKPLITWYLAIIIPFSIIYLISLNLYIWHIYQSLVFVLVQLIGVSYLTIYSNRLVALFYLSK